MSAAPAEKKKNRPPAAGALFALLILTAMNMLNYVDRWVPSAVKSLFQDELGLTDDQTSYPLTGFIVVYMIMSPIFGALAEKWNRRYLVAFGVAAWSIATAAAAFTHNFWTFLIARALVGVGEAAYATLAPSILADFYPPERRNRIFTLFYVAIPVGSALGFALGGVIGEHFGWRAAFLAVGVPGILVAGLALLMKDPKKGQFDGKTPEHVAWPAAIKALIKNKTYVFSVAGYTLVTFATGGIADWFAVFLQRERGMSIQNSALALGVSSVVGGLIGTTFGGYAADHLKKYTRQPYMALSGLSMIPGLVLCILGIWVFKDVTIIIGCVLVSQVFLWAYNSPINALLVNSVDPGMRARAFGLSILCIHLLGDALSPPIIGRISEVTGSLSTALILVPITIAAGCAVWIVGWRVLPDTKIDPEAAAAH